jgi:hypothetical protein
MRRCANHPSTPRANPIRFATIVIALLALAAGCEAAPRKNATRNANADSKSAARTETATAGKSACADFYAPDFRLTAGRGEAAPVAIAKEPAKGVPYAEPNFRTCVVRATDHREEYTKAAFLRSDYSRREAFNADNTRFFVFSPDGFWHLFDADSLKYLGLLNGLTGDAEPQWDPKDPNRLYYVPNYGGTRLYALDIRNGRGSVAADFSGSLPPWAKSAQHIWTKSEGSPSADARFWGFQVEDGSYKLLGYIVWDLAENKLVGAMKNDDRPDHVSMTPSGRWFTLSGDDAGTWAWSPDFRQKKKLHHKSEHSDLAIGPDGHDYYVSIDYQSSRGDIFMVDIDACPSVPADAADAPACPRTTLFDTYIDGSVGALHISGKAFQKPGWVLLSAYGTQPTRAGRMPWFANKVFALELKADPKVYELAYHHSQPSGYWFEPQATVNRDFTRVLFNSSWDSTDEKNIDAYLIRLPPNALR